MEDVRQRAEENAAAAARHIPKHARRDKNVEAVFDEQARREFLTGFHKRKKQRRKAAEHNQVQKARQDRLVARKERRDELKELLSRYEQNGEGGEEAAGREEVAPVAVEYPGVVVTVQALGAEGEERAPKHRTRPSAASAALPKAKRAKQR